jgi:predicted permease
VDQSSEIVSASIFAARGPALKGVSVLRIPGMSERSLAVLPRLAGVALVVLLIAVANAASLLLMRAMRRRREIAIRLALGITRPRLIGQLMTESTLLALVAGGAALVIAGWTGGALRSQLASFRWTDTVVDERVIWFVVLVAVLAGAAAGLAPAVFALRADISASLKSGGSPTTSTLRSTLLVTQAALCTLLLACGGAFLQSARRAGEFDRGFDVERTIQVSIPAYDADAEQRLARITERIRDMPGVEVAGRTFIALDQVGLLTKVGPTYRDTIGVGPRGPSLEFVGADFMRAAGFRVLAGRPLGESDAFARVAVLNESLAEALFARGGAVGACVYVREPDSPCREVIGVVGDVRWDAAEQPRYRVYVPVTQAWTVPPRALIPNYMYVRTRTASTVDDVTRLRSLIGRMMSHPAELSITRVVDRLRPQLRPWRLAATLFLVLGALGLLAAAAGIYGLVAYDVTERTRELGVRIALGARSTSILRLVVGSGLRVVLLGVASGAAATLSLGPLVASVLFATTLYDPVVLGTTGLILAGAAGVASLLPALRATRIDPAVALASE